MTCNANSSPGTKISGQPIPNNNVIVQISGSAAPGCAITDTEGGSGLAGADGSLSFNVSHGGSGDRIIRVTFTTTASSASGQYQCFYFSSDPPDAPTISSARAGDGRATLVIDSSASGSIPTSFVVTPFNVDTSSSLANQACAATISGTSSSATCDITSLTNGTRHTFTATGTNSWGTSTSSSPTSQVTPMGTQTVVWAPATSLTPAADPHQGPAGAITDPVTNSLSLHLGTDSVAFEFHVHSRDIEPECYPVEQYLDATTVVEQHKHGTVPPASSASPSSSTTGSTATPSGSTSPSPSSSSSSTPTADSSASSTRPGTTEPNPSDSPATPGGDPTTPTDGGGSTESAVSTREATVKFTVAQGDQTLTFTVPMTRMLAIASEAATVEPALADTGESNRAPLAVATVLAATALMVLPAIRRRRVRD